MDIKTEEIIKRIVESRIDNYGSVEDAFIINTLIGDGDKEIKIVDLIDESEEDSYSYADYIFKLIVEYQNNYWGVNLSYSSYTDINIGDIFPVKPRIRKITLWDKI